MQVDCQTGLLSPTFLTSLALWVIPRPCLNKGYERAEVSFFLSQGWKSYVCLTADSFNNSTPLPFNSLDKSLSIKVYMASHWSALSIPLMFMDKHQPNALERLKATFHGALKNDFIFEYLSTIFEGEWWGKTVPILTMSNTLQDKFFGSHQLPVSTLKALPSLRELWCLDQSRLCPRSDSNFMWNVLFAFFVFHLLLLPEILSHWSSEEINWSKPDLGFSRGSKVYNEGQLAF